MKKTMVSALAAVLLSGCATPPDKIQATYVSNLKYNTHDCDQIARELDNVSQRTNRLYHSLDEKASTDAWQMGVGLFLLWPTLFFLEGGDGPEAAEYAQLKGEFDALEKSAVQKKCQLAATSPEETIAKLDEKEFARLAQL